MGLAVTISFDPAKDTSLRPKTHFEVFFLLHGYALHFVAWKVFVLRIFSLCFWLSTSTSKLPFIVFLTIWGLSLLEITFSIKNGYNSAMQFHFKEFWVFCCFIPWRFRFVFLFEKATGSICFFLPILCFPTIHGIQLLVIYRREGSPFALVETGIH